MLIVGLGNSGSEYDETRHNVGFMAADAIHDRYNFPAYKAKFRGQYAKGIINGADVHLLKPSTFMNKSGIAVAELVRFYKTPLSDIFVIHDELDVPVGKVKFKTGGGAGGHNGIKSIDSHVGKMYNRLRIGIDHPGDKDKVHSYVLGKFSSGDKQVILPLLSDIASNIDILLNESGVNFTTKLALINNTNKSSEVKNICTKEPSD